MESAELIVGSKIIMRSKADLIAEFGADENNNPNTSVTWNPKGNMDHLFGITGVIDTISADRDWVTVDFDTHIPGKDYEWTLGLDMMTGSLIPTVLPKAIKLRNFLDTVKKEPTSLQVWKALGRLKTKESLKSAQVIYLYKVYSQVGYEEFYKFITTVIVSDIEAISIPTQTLATVQEYYPTLNKVLRNLVAYTFAGHPENLALLLAMKIPVNLQEDLIGENPLTPLQRINITKDILDIDLVWPNLEFVEKELDNVTSIDTLKDIIIDTLVEYLNTNKLHTLNTAKVKVTI